MKKILVGLLGVLAMTGNALAASIVDVATFAVDTTALGTVGGVVLLGLGGIWGVRKLVKFINRS